MVFNLKPLASMIRASLFGKYRMALCFDRKIEQSDDLSRFGYTKTLNQEAIQILNKVEMLLKLYFLFIERTQSKSRFRVGSHESLLIFVTKTGCWWHRLDLRGPSGAGRA